LPYQDAKGNGHRDKGGKWILKMHGCVTHPEDIVLTREDYIRYKCVRILHHVGVKLIDFRDLL
jgi:hypothetical protein